LLRPCGVSADEPDSLGKWTGMRVARPLLRFGRPACVSQHLCPEKWNPVLVSHGLPGAARRRQQERAAGKRDVTCNARMGTRDLKAFCALDEATLELVKMAMNELKLSARAYDRILKVARTIADLAGSDRLTSEHISEAIQYRSLDRQLWA